MTVTSLYIKPTIRIFTTVLFEADINHVTRSLLRQTGFTPLYHSEIVYIQGFY